MESAAISVPHIVIARRATPDVAISTWQSTPPLAIVIARSEATWQSTPPLPPVPVLPPLGGDKNGNAIGTATGDLHELPTAPRDTVSAPSAAYRRGDALRRRDKDGRRGTLRRWSRRGRWRNRAKAPPRANPLRLKFRNLGSPNGGAGAKRLRGSSLRIIEWLTEISIRAGGAPPLFTIHCSPFTVHLIILPAPRRVAIPVRKVLTWLAFAGIIFH